MGKQRPERLVVNQAPEPDPFPHLPVMANDHGRGVGTWVVGVKHTQLCKYIDSARFAAQKWKRGWVYLDPFCGPGRLRVVGETCTRPGGAVTAWLQSQFSGSPFSKVLVGDLDAAAVAACEARLKAVAAPVKSYNLPAVEAVAQMIDDVPEGALCLAYVDPFKISVLAFDIFRKLAERRVDLIVNFFTSDLRRNVDSAKDELNPGWKQRISPDRNRSGLAAAWFDDWQQQVQGLGFQMSRAMQTVENSNNSEMYRLVFFAKERFPLGLWNDVAADPTKDLFAGLD
jgi:three-Cys-motif partner protein